MQNKISKSGDLLDKNGHLIECGYATKLIKTYDRNKIKAGKLRIKEWDYYLVYNKKYAVALTVADNGYMGMLSASVIRFDEKKEKTTSIMTIMPLGKFNMPRSSEKGDVVFKNKKVEANFKHVQNRREIYFHMENFENKKPLDVKLILENSYVLMI